MDQLQAVVAYWRDCIKAEGALEQSFGVQPSKFVLNPRSRGVLFKGKRDPFIFAGKDFEYFVEKGKTHGLIARAQLKGQDLYFGYPLLMFFDRSTRRNHIAPLFSMRLNVELGKDGLMLRRGESSPTLGACAFEKLGLQPEETAALNSEVSEIFDSGKSSKLETILYLLKKTTKLSLVENIDPDKLSTNTAIHPYDGTVVYNKAILSVGEASIYNLHVLNDLEKLAKRKNLLKTSLKYIDSNTTSSYSDVVPILPFLFDEHQLLAIRRILGSEQTVVTGPPGTGKSQFIANLIINLFLQKKKVLFVSHTGEAVRVVNERINKDFANLIMQTGKKELRQDLGRRLEEMVARYNDQQVTPRTEASLEDITHNWENIRAETAYLNQTNNLHKKLEARLHMQTAMSRSDRLDRRIMMQLARLQTYGLIRKMRKRRPNYEVLYHTEQLKTRHVSISRSYVKANYLALILESGQYGKLAAYIDAVQNKKFTSGHTQDKSEKYIRAALQAMNIWSCTLKSLAATFPLRANIFDYVIFDEASQIDLPSAAPALYRAKNVVVVGDENQLNHITKINPHLEEELAKKHVLSEQSSYPALTRYTDTSLFKSAKKALHEPERELKNHYRSNTIIANLFSSIFYGGKLRVHEPESNLPEDIRPGAYWMDVKGTAYKYKSGSRYNPREAAFVLKLLEKLLPVAHERGLTVGVATPYTKQADIIAEKATAAFDDGVLANLQVLTVHKFQGAEVDILIFSPVLSQKGDSSSDYWFIKNKQILNVAVSRAKQLLLITGDLDFALQSESKLKDIAEYCNRVSQHEEDKIPNRPMNIFEKKLLALIETFLPRAYKLEPQYVVGGRFTLDFALLSKRKKVAIELDGQQHEIVGDLPVFEDRQRDEYLVKEGWTIVRVTVHELLKEPDAVVDVIKNALLSERTSRHIKPGTKPIENVDEYYQANRKVN